MVDAGELYAQSRVALSEGRHQAALEAIRAALAIDPQFPNAQNFAGWVLLRSPDCGPVALEEAIGHFEAALDTDPNDATALSNLADALLAAKRDVDAVRRLSELSQGGPLSVRAHNWLGWYYTERDLPRALDHLAKAVRVGGRWAPPYFNYARALDLADRADEAYRQYGNALTCRENDDPTFCHARRAEFEAARGWIRHALGSVRRARFHEQQSPRGRDTALSAVEARLVTIVSSRRLYFPHSDDERRWHDLEVAGRRDGRGIDVLRDRPSLSRFEQQLEETRRVLADTDHSVEISRVLQGMHETVHARQLPSELGGLSFAIEAGSVRDGSVRRLLTETAEAWSRVHYLLYDSLLREEVPPVGPCASVDALLREGRVDEALAELDSACRQRVDALIDATGILERAGERAIRSARHEDALKLLGRALEGYRMFASGATSGGEGMARMLDVRRLEARIEEAGKLSMAGPGRE